MKSSALKPQASHAATHLPTFDQVRHPKVNQRSPLISHDCFATFLTVRSSQKRIDATQTL
jgi:hypothetical protein